MRTLTAGAQMFYSIIAIEDQALKDRLVNTCDHQPFIVSAPHLLLFVADYQRWMDMFAAAGYRRTPSSWASGRARRIAVFAEIQRISRESGRLAAILLK